MTPDVVTPDADPRSWRHVRMGRLTVSPFDGRLVCHCCRKTVTTCRYTRSARIDSPKTSIVGGLIWPQRHRWRARHIGSAPRAPRASRP